MSTWRSAAPCPAPSCARCSPRPTTRSGGQPPTVRHDDTHLPIWHEASGRYLDSATGEFLPTWDEALDAIGDHDAPLHVARFGQGSTLRASSPERATRLGASAT